VTLVAYVLINLALIAAWAVTGFGYFWPGWVLGFWGVFLLLDAWNAYYRRPVSTKRSNESYAIVGKRVRACTTTRRRGAAAWRTECLHHHTRFRPAPAA
jgi:2TM domain